MNLIEHFLAVGAIILILLVAMGLSFAFALWLDYLEDKNKII